MIEIKYTVQNENVNDFKTWFLKVRPIPLDGNGNPQMTALEWIKRCGKLYFLKQCKIGKQKIALEGLLIGEIIE